MACRSNLGWICLTSILFLSCNEGQKEYSEPVKSLLGFTIPEERINSFIEYEMESKGINGASIAIVNNGAIAYKKVFGYSNKENEQKVTVETIFEGASLSKPLFAYFVMMLVQDGILTLDKPLYKYLENSELSEDNRYKRITARMVLSHTSGLPNWREFESDKKLKILDEPGTVYRYSGEGYQYLTKVLKHLLRTDSQGLDQIFQEKVIIPLNLKNIWFVQNDFTRKHKAQPYDKKGNKIDWNQSYWYQKDNNVFVGASSMHTEAVAYADWLVALMNNRGLNQGGYEELFKDHSITPHRQFGAVKYALGFFKSELPFGTIYSHEGGQEGFSSWFSMEKNKKWAIILFTNSESGGEMGLDLTLFLLFGRPINHVYIIASLIIIPLLFAFIFGIKKTLKKIHKNK